MQGKEELRVLLKQEMRLALEQFRQHYKKISKGIEIIYTQAMLSTDSKEIQRLHTKFFGFITKSRNAKEKFA